MTDKPQFPANWQIKDYDPNEHLINLKGKQYLDVQNRMLWFLRDQRAFIVAGLATCAYTIHTELVELDREAGFALFKTTIRDVLGNEVIGYGSETVRDFGDYIEKASTKSQGRALLALGYGTAFAPEMDEGERVVDAPVEPRKRQPAPPQRQAAAPATPVQQPAATDLPADDFDVLENSDLAQYIGIFGTDYRNEFVRICGIKPKGGYTEEDGQTWRAHLLAKAREKAAIETRVPGSLKGLKVGEKGQ